MKKIVILLGILIVQNLYSQGVQSFSALNPAMFLYNEEDVFINPPSKYNNGQQLIVPDPEKYPWESKLENGMPNVLVDHKQEIVSIYLSSFVGYSPTPPSKVGVLAYYNPSDDIRQWKRASPSLYWYNPQGKTGDELISSTYKSGYLSTNIVAVDIESVGIFDDYQTDNNPIKLIYLPQRESHNKIISSYEMKREFNAEGILTGFTSMKSDRIKNQKNFTFKFINGDTHMNFLKIKDDYLFVSRLNSKRSTLLSTETLPLTPDNRKRYRRETVTWVGPQLVSKPVDLNIALDMSNEKWEPYSMQPFQLSDHENDIWWGLVTMFGSAGFSDTEYKQRTELAISNDGIHWRYVKRGVPFLDNGTDPSSDDYGCINIAKPIQHFFWDPTLKKLYYFYASSKQRHVSGRNSGVSLAIGKYGKIAGLNAGSTEKVFYSQPQHVAEGLPEDCLQQYSIADAFYLHSHFYPSLLADIYEDPRGKDISKLTSYAAVSIYAYDKTKDYGKGMFLCGVLGSSKKGTTEVSDDYEEVEFMQGSFNSTKKGAMLKYLKAYSDAHPNEIVSIKHFPKIPVVLEAKIKKATLYDIQFQRETTADNFVLDIEKASFYNGGNIWTYDIPQPSVQCHTIDFSSSKPLPNQTLPNMKVKGSLTVSVQPQSGSGEQTVLRMYNDDNNYSTIIYDNNSKSFIYKMVKDNQEFSSMSILPPRGDTFDDKLVYLTLEAVPYNERKMGHYITEDAAVFTVTCPDLGYSASKQQPILWGWKHNKGSITPADSANARAFAYLQFSSFISNPKKLTIGGKNESCETPFAGQIFKVQFAEKLPDGLDFFWPETPMVATKEN